MSAPRGRRGVDEGRTWIGKETEERGGWSAASKQWTRPMTLGSTVQTGNGTGNWGGWE